MRIKVELDILWTGIGRILVMSELVSRKKVLKVAHPYVLENGDNYLFIYLG
jgi:hypothetical protein